jgi:hypothetical protein
MERLAAVDVERGRFEAAARLLGAAEALRRVIGAPRAPVYQPQYNARLTTLRNALDEEAFTAAWEAGRAMTWEEAVAYALDENAT